MAPASARRMTNALLRGVLVSAMLVSPVGHADPLAPGQAASELTRQGLEHAHEGNDDLAVRRFVEALSLDAHHGPAYLALGAARERAGDLEEAARTYDLAIANIPGFAAAYRARAALRRRMGEQDGELADLETATAITETPEGLRELAARYVESKAWPAALATWRKIAQLAQQHNDEPARREAAMKARALALLSGELDPVTGGAAERGWVR